MKKLHLLSFSLITITFLFLLFIGITPNITVNAATVHPNGLQNDAVYIIKNRRSGYYMDVSNASVTNGTQVQVFYRNDPYQAQMFKVRFDSTNSGWELQPIHVGTLNMSLDIPGGSTSNNAILQIYADNNTNSQRFLINRNSDGSYQILTKTTNYTKELVVYNGSTAVGEKVVQYTKDLKGYSGDWYFIQIDNDVLTGKTFYKNEYPEAPNHPVYGEARFVEEIIQNEKTEMGNNYWGTPIYKNIPRRVTRIWTYPQVAINIPVYRDTTNMDPLQPGETVIWTEDKTWDFTITHKQGLEYGLGIANTVASSLGISTEGLNIGVSNSTSVSADLKEYFEYEQTLGIRSSYMKQRTLTNPYTDRVRYYVYETRELYNLYYVQVYDINYNITYKQTGIFGTYTTEIWTEKDTRTLKEVLYNWKDSAIPATAPYPYIFESGVLKYDGYPEANVIYY